MAGQKGRKWVRKIIRINPINLHIKESREGLRSLRVLNVSFDESVVQMDIWLINLIENVYHHRLLTAEGEGGDELGCRVDILVKVGFEDLDVDLLMWLRFLHLLRS
ncbi:hypothetical protein ACFX2C_022597 [Malus domestica]